LIREAACGVHARRKAAAGKKEIPLSPIAVEVVRRIDALFEIERSINGRSAEERVQVRQTLTRRTDGCVSPTMPPKEALRGIALGGGRRAAAMYSLIVTAKMNGIDPQAWLTDILARIAAQPAHRLDELLPWNWTPASAISARAA
jgi:hypothetical protein